MNKPLEKTPAGKPIPGGLQIVILDTAKAKDVFVYRLGLAKNHEPGGAYVHSEVDKIYLSHITAEKKTRDGRGIEKWVKIKERNDLFDCEAGNMLLADPEWHGGVMVLRSPHLNGKRQEPKVQQSPVRREDRMQKTSRW